MYGKIGVNVLALKQFRKDNDKRKEISLIFSKCNSDIAFYIEGNSILGLKLNVGIQEMEKETYLTTTLEKLVK